MYCGRAASEFEEDNRRTRAAALVRLPDGNEVRAHGYASR
ncbi:dsRBD fold-containing protein, partial [Streptomyces sp. NPDC079189]